MISHVRSTSIEKGGPGDDSWRSHASALESCVDAQSTEAMINNGGVQLAAAVASHFSKRT